MATKEEQGWAPNSAADRVAVDKEAVDKGARVEEGVHSNADVVDDGDVERLRASERE